MTALNKLKEKIQTLLARAKDELLSADSSITVYQIKTQYLGKKGSTAELMKELKNLSEEDRPLFGKELNLLKTSIEEIYAQRLTQLKEQELEKQISEDKLDLTLPGVSRSLGALHPIEKMIRRASSIFQNLGYILAQGPLIETDWYNFSALNIPLDHPSRDNDDTFYLDSENLLRTHTSPVQIRSLEKLEPPMAIISPGPVFRRDHPDASHFPFFHQVEGLLIDKKVSMGHLKGTLSYFLRSLYGQKAKVRFRASFFPFTEPSAEYDCSCFLCQGGGCSLCKKSGWIEMGGCGLVHPNVLKASQVDPDKWQGFAFGMGIERLALLEYSIPDIRLLYENRMDFLQQFE